MMNPYAGSLQLCSGRILIILNVQRIFPKARLRELINFAPSVWLDYRTTFSHASLAYSPLPLPDFARGKPFLPANDNLRLYWTHFVSYSTDGELCPGRHSVILMPWSVLFNIHSFLSQIRFAQSMESSSQMVTLCLSLRNAIISFSR